MKKNEINDFHEQDKSIIDQTKNISTYILNDDEQANNNSPTLIKKQPLINRVSKLFFIFAIIFFILSLIPTASTLFLILYILILVLFAFFTLFTIFLNESFNNHFKSVMSFSNVLSDLLKYTPYLLSISTILFWLCALLSLVSKKRNEKKVLIIFSFILMIITAFIAISLFIKK